MAPSNVFFWWLILIEVRIVCFVANMIVLLNKNEIEENNLKMASMEVLPSLLWMPQSKECFNTYFNHLPTFFPPVFLKLKLVKCFYRPVSPSIFLSDIFIHHSFVFRQLFWLWHLWDSNSKLLIMNPPLYQFRNRA